MVSVQEEDRWKPWVERHECIGVEILSAAGLVSKHKGKPDTYVKMLVPSKVQNTIIKKTRLMKRSNDPVYEDSDTVWMDENDLLHIEVWEKRVIGQESCLGKALISKMDFPPGVPSTAGYFTQVFVLPLSLPSKDRRAAKTEPLRVPTLTGSNERVLAASHPPKSDSEAPSVAPLGTIAIRINYESRHQEWVRLAPFRGKILTWGAVKSQAPDQLVLEPQLVEGLPELMGEDPPKFVVMTNGFFTVLMESGQYYQFGINYRKVQEGERACYEPASVGVNHIGQKIVLAASGGSHFLLVTEKGQLFSLGMNSRGELGQGNPSNAEFFDLMPKRAVGLNNEFVVGVAAGKSHSLAWTKEGVLYSWGDASLLRMWTPETDWFDAPFDALGHSIEDESKRANRDIAPVPKKVQGLDGIQIVKAYTNTTISAAISSERNLYTWGDHHCAGYDSKNLNIQYPQLIEPLAGRVIEAAVGPSFVVALDNDGVLWSWGCAFQKNSAMTAAFPLGRGGQRSFVPEEITGIPKMRCVTCIGTTLFAVDVGGHLWCWGDSGFGECFSVGVTYGKPVKSPFFTELKVRTLASGYGTAFCVYTEKE